MADERNITQVDADEVEEKHDDSVFVELVGPAWTRHNFETGKTRRHRRGSKFYITQGEFKALQNSRFPSVRVAEED